ncbi:hypothetical protein ULMA_06700 [Patiriisocius marinus]|uniref:Uncharacterized protein n=1 Tax=Patiriisocius marinus TaxID=1397112 RepID=A0A5J4IW57_9FLAO|nr:T9SS type A sorting domain-containing protein [Patiriisocius marinus]GER58562.1 hypothetical protein ULMA_06700 [Patiriisocius marinus]
MFSKTNVIAQERVSCNSEPIENAYLNDLSYLNSEALIDILNEHGYEIPSDYLYNLDDAGQYIGDIGRQQKKAAIPKITKVPIKAWIYRNDNGSGNLTQNNVTQIINGVNQLLSFTNIHFYLLCDITEINNSQYANNGDQYHSDYTTTNRMENALNIHFVIDSNVSSGNDWAGKANFPFSPLSSNKYSLALRDSGLTNADKTPILSHEIGHAFGLFHTHYPGRSTSHTDNGGCGDCHQESVSRTKRQGAGCVWTYNELKCNVNGDFLCDTPADPNLFGQTSGCLYTANHTDNWNQVWVPEVANIMGQAPQACLNTLSPLQIGKMLLYINLMNPNHPTINITGNDFLCSGSTATYQAISSQNVTAFSWSTSSNYTILSGQGTNTITVQANNNNNGYVSVNTNCGHKETKKTIEGIYLIEVDGVTDVCPNTNHTYSTQYLSGATYNWTVSSGTIIFGQGTNSAVIEIAPDPSYQSNVTVNITNYCNFNTSAGYTVDIYNPGPGDPPCVDNGGNDDRTSLNNKNLETSTFLFPNPANYSVNINIDNNDNYTLEIYDINGVVVRNNDEIYQNKEIDTSNWKEGIYIFKFRSKNMNFFKKLIIKK